jgi:uncharacterized membrane protein
MSGPAIVVGPLNGFIIAYVVGRAIGSDWSTAAQNLFLLAGAVVGLLVTIWLINDEAKADQ